MTSTTALLLAAELVLSGPTPPGQVRNDGFEQTTIRAAADPHVAAMRKMGWTFLSPLEWPTGWEGTDGVSNVRFAVVHKGAHTGTRAILLWGQAGSSGYLATTVKGLSKGIYRASFWGRGKGRATLMAAGLHVVLNAAMTPTWAEYAGVFRNTVDPVAREVSVTLQAQKAEVFFDDVCLVKCTVLEADVVEESIRMRRKGQWLTPGAKVSPASVHALLGDVTRLLPTLRRYAQADPIPERMELLRLLADRTAGLAQAKGPPTAEHANRAAAYAAIAKRLVTELEFEDVTE